MQRTGICGGEISPESKASRAAYPGRLTTVITLAGIDPLWKWLFSTRAGLLQADG